MTDGLLATAAPLPGLVHFLAQHVHGHVATQCHLRRLPILQGKRDLLTRPIQPDDVQRIVAHVAFSRAIGRRTFVFRLSFVSTLPHWTLWAAHFPFVPLTRDMTSLSISPFFRNQVQDDKRSLLEDISGEGGGADASIDEWAEGLTVRHRLLDQEEELAMRSMLPWHIPLHGRCA